MKINKILATTALSIAVVAFFIAAQKHSISQAEKETLVMDTPLKNKLDSVSMALGISIGKNIMGADINELNFDAFVAGMKKAFDHQVNPAELQKAQQTVDGYVQELQNAKVEKMMRAGAEFLENNAKQPGVVTLPSGLQYKVIQQGTGVKPVDGDNVVTHYHGTFIDGKVFDSSVDRGQPSSFGVNQVIKGWTEALKLMPEGSKWMLYIPYDLAYGPNGRGSIPPYSTLIFEVELIDVVGK